MAIKKIKHDHLSTRGAIILVVFILVLIGATYLFTRYMLIKGQAREPGDRWIGTSGGKVIYKNSYGGKTGVPLGNVTQQSLENDLNAYNKYMKEKYGKEPHYKLDKNGKMTWSYQ